MRNFLYIFLALFFVSCQENFDEWTDTDQRRITFDVDTRNFFGDYLTMQGNEFTKSNNFLLEPAYKIRVAYYCYDHNGALVQHSTILLDEPGIGSVTLKHLQKDMNYRFEFFADIVKYDKAVDYYESWYQLGTDSLSTSYLFCFQPNDHHQNNIVKHTTIHTTPNNNRVSVEMVSITVNGYCILSNLQGVEMVNGYYSYNESFMVESMQGRRRSSHTYSYLPNGIDQIVIPVTTGCIGDTVSVKIKRIMLDEIDSTYIYVKNPENKSFVTDIDCKTLKQKTCIYF